MNKFLQFLGWKDYRDRWDWNEINTDITFTLLFIVVIAGAFYLNP